MKKSRLDSNIEKIVDPTTKEVLRTMRREYMMAVKISRLVISLLILFVISITFYLIVYGFSKIGAWFQNLDGGFTKSGIASLIITTILGVVGIPTAYSFGKKKNKYITK